MNPGKPFFMGHRLSYTLSLALWCCFTLLTIFVGCKPAQTTNTVVAKASSPDGKSLAVLVDRYYHAARIADEYFLIVIPLNQNVEQAVNAKDIGTSSALVATWASKVQLRWQGNTALYVICDSCGLKPIDISKKLDHIGPIKIIYQGFPEHTAYS